MGDIAEDHINSMIDQGYYPFARPRVENEVICKHCGAGGLRWTLTHTVDGEKYALFTRNGSKHVCARVEEVFEDLTGESDE